MGPAKKSAAGKAKRSNPYSAFAEKGAQAYRSIRAMTETASETTEVSKNTKSPRRRSKPIKKFDEFVKQQEQRQKKKGQIWKEDPFFPTRQLERQSLDKKIAKRLFKFASKYRPETRAMKKERQELERIAAGSQEVKSNNDEEDSSDDEDNGSTRDSKYYEDAIHNKDGEDDKDKNDKPDKTNAADTEDTSGRVCVLKFGINHIAALIQEKKAKLVLIADDVSPPEIAEWIPTLCRKAGVPYCLVNGKARLGNLVNKKQAPAVAFSEVRPSDKAQFDSLIKDIKDYNAMLKDSTKNTEFKYTGLPELRVQLMRSLVGRSFQNLDRLY
ncbi:hypothetical protein BGX26_007615 [Mortierella sp. AD094]|nr:hypothetical protein BGX26_007615 [Mortierella sp. AD094]